MYLLTSQGYFSMEPGDDVMLCPIVAKSSEPQDAYVLRRSRITPLTLQNGEATIDLTNPLSKDGAEEALEAINTAVQRGQDYAILRYVEESDAKSRQSTTPYAISLP